MKSFDELLRQLRGPDWNPPERMLCLDPGETLGFAAFSKGKLIMSAQTDIRNEPGKIINDLFKRIKPTLVVCENYRIYAAKSDSHTWSSLFTPRVLGGIWFLSDIYSIPLVLQMASTAKQFCTNDKLKQWGFYSKGHSHANDAVRHGLYFLLFDKKHEKLGR